MKGEVGEKGPKATEQDYKDLQEFVDSKNKEKEMEDKTTEELKEIINPKAPIYKHAHDIPGYHEARIELARRQGEAVDGAKVKQARGLGLRPVRIKCELWNQDIEGNPSIEGEDTYIFNFSKEEYKAFIKKLEAFLNKSTPVDFKDEQRELDNYKWDDSEFIKLGPWLEERPGSEL